MQNVHRDGPPRPRRRPSAASPRIFGFPQAVFMIFASLGKSKRWNGVSHFFDARSDKVRFQLKIKVFYRCVPGYLFFGAFRETGKSFLRGRLRWRIRILLTCSPVLTCRGVRSEHQLVKAEAERTAQNSAPRADFFLFQGRLF